MALYTKSGLRVKIAEFSRRDPRFQTKSASEILFNEAVRVKKTDSFNIFLSHSYLDWESVLALKLDIEEMGFSIYVDWIVDASLDRTNVTKETANLLRDRMARCDSLFVATSPNSSNSKWMPWELGYFDGIKKRVAILPVLDTTQASDYFEGQEYLGLYHYITKDPTRNTDEMTLWVHEDETTYVKFSSWLNGTEPQKH